MKTLEEYKAMTTHPGKFEMESALTPYLWECSMHGDGEEIASMEQDGHFACRFELTCEEWEMFNGGNEDFAWEWILVEDSQGFVYSFSPKHYHSWK